MRYDQYYLVHRLIENLSGEGGEEEGGILEVMVPSVFNKRMGQKRELEMIEIGQKL